MSDTGLPEVPAPGAAKEPLLNVGVTIALCTAILGALTAFGLDISDDRQSAVLAIVGILAPIVVALIGRTKVWSPATVRAAIIQAKTQRANRAAPSTSNVVVTDAAVDESVQRSIRQADERRRPGSVL